MKYIIDLYTGEMRLVGDEEFDRVVNGAGVNKGRFPLPKRKGKHGTVYGGLDSKTGKPIHFKVGIELDLKTPVLRKCLK